jgi:hypothetical protein
MSTDKVLGCRLSVAEWDDFNRFRAKHFAAASTTVVLRVLLQLALSVTGDAKSLWQNQPRFIPEGWFTNIMLAYADGVNIDKGLKPAGKPAKAIRVTKRDKVTAAAKVVKT